jgi:hypothetical protein
MLFWDGMGREEGADEVSRFMLYWTKCSLQARLRRLASRWC